MSKRYILGSFFIVVALASFLTFKATRISLPDKQKSIQILSNHIRSDLRRESCAMIKTAKQSIYLASFGISDPYLIQLLNAKASEGVSISIVGDSSLVKKN